MRFKLIGTTVAAMATLQVSSALAADMPLKAARAPAVFSWAGWYAGVNGGYGWADPSATITPSTAPLPAGGVMTTPAAPFTLSTSPEGAVVGGQIGYNWQFNRTVVGVELDIDYSNIQDTQSGSFINLITIGLDAGRTLGNATLETKMNWFGTLRGRLGYAFDRVLPYVTGGLAVANMKSTLTVSGSHWDIGGGIPGTFVSAFSNSASANDTVWGFAIGGGVDVALDPRWVLRGEYLFLGFQDKTHTAVIPGASSFENSMDVHIVRAALNYRFAP